MQPVAIVISDMGSGGAQRVVALLANAWSASGRSVMLITLGSADADFYPLDRRIRRVGLGLTGAVSGFAGPIIANLRRIRRLREILKSSDAQLVVSLIAPTNVLTVLASFGLGKWVIISERNDPSRQSFGWAWDRLRELSYRLADRVTANSQGVVAMLAGRLPPSKVFLAPNPVVPPPDGEVVATKSGPTVLAVGRLHRQKAYDILLEAFAIFRRSHPGWTLRVLGAGPLEAELRSQAADLGIAGAVEWLGAVSDPFPHYRAADVFVLASRHEGMPNALLEAMVCGLPSVVTTASPGPLELVQDGVSGLAVPAEDPTALAVALGRFADNPELAAAMGLSARKSVQRHEIDSVLREWERIFDFRGAR